MMHTHHKLGLECEAAYGPMRAFVTPMCTDSRPAHIRMTHTQHKINLECEAMYFLSL